MRILPSSDLPAELESHDVFGAAHGDLEAEIQALAALKAVRLDGLDGFHVFGAIDVLLLLLLSPTLNT